MFEIESTNIEGCKLITPDIHSDERGCFTKIYHNELFIKYGLESDFKEEYYTISKKNVLRGLHFQLPPHEHVKLVHCISGKVMDVVVDLRNGSKTYGKYEAFELSDQNKQMIYIPKGLAHGFYVLSSSSTLLYKVTSVYSPEHDRGILWNSLDIPWPNNDPIISHRDSSFF